MLRQVLVAEYELVITIHQLQSRFNVYIFKWQPHSKISNLTFQTKINLYFGVGNVLNL